MNVDGVRNGIVLDHIAAGKSMEIYRLLNLDQLSCSVAVLQNVQSKKYGIKDMIKIDEMIDINLDIIGYIDPNITINIVKDNELVSKKHLSLPEKLDNVIFCKSEMYNQRRAGNSTQLQAGGSGKKNIQMRIL